MWGCAMSRWPSLLPLCSDARLAPERSPRPEGVWHLLFPLSTLPVTGLAALFLLLRLRAFAEWDAVTGAF